ncbi:MAG TPA: biotin carboxylase N-terminal domain-containing protein [Candidatus Limnocylindria bacterium]|nr:biotin carboxylase N-terminal domain-containing protein [Candidatus Limnocylindria bacterium]
MPLTLLVANRGEIARRIFRTARRMGFRTVAVFSDADAREPFAREADAAVRLGPPPARGSYLATDRILAAARETGATVIHPGYGFLAEEARFAEAARAAGLTFVGPPPAVLRLLGSKAESKRSARRANVPVLEGYEGEDQSDGALLAAARRLGYPLLVKPSAGGGGKGMVTVRDERELADAITSSRRIAASAFGDERLILEREVQRPRHVEVQFVADATGGVSILGERDCSAQRRHQKILEEAPAPHLGEATRGGLFSATERLVREVGYVNAGTAEFVVGEDGSFHFLEVNARLQVEHPVTEAVRGIDLVEQQLRIAAGEPLAVPNAPPRGHAIEARVYAEDPEAEFVPSTGAVLHARWPEGVRVDAGVEEGSTVTRFYDPLIAKVIAHGADRAAALVALERALGETEVLGVRTNLAFLRRLLTRGAVRDGFMTTDLVDRDLPTLVGRDPTPEEAYALAAATAYESSRGPAPRRDPWTAGGSWRAFDRGGSPIVVRDGAGERTLRVVGAESLHIGPHVLTLSPAERHQWAIDGEPGAGALDRPRAWVWIRGGTHVLEIGARERERDGVAEADLAAPLPGVVVAVTTRTGAKVARGDTLVVVEAMKMELPVRAPADGTVRAVRCAVGDQVERGERLIDFEAVP